jgi:hypothetical protein
MDGGSVTNRRNTYHVRADNRIRATDEAITQARVQHNFVRPEVVGATREGRYFDVEVEDNLDGVCDCTPREIYHDGQGNR